FRDVQGSPLPRDLACFRDATNDLSRGPQTAPPLSEPQADAVFASAGVTWRGLGWFEGHTVCDSSRTVNASAVCFARCANAWVAAKAGIAYARVPPRGTKELSPALQRWETSNKNSECR